MVVGIIMIRLVLTPWGLHLALFASSGAAPSTVMPRVCGRRVAIGIRRAIATPPLARAFSGFITLDLFYPLTLGRGQGVCGVFLGVGF